MNNINNIVSKYGINVCKIEFFNNNIIIYSDNNNYLIKDNSNSKEVFNYLDSINCGFHLKLISSYSENFELYEFSNLLIDNNIKGKLCVDTFSLINEKSSFAYDISEKELNELYDKYNNQIDKTLNYYLKIQDYLEEVDIFSPSEYLLLLNISDFYKLLHCSKKYLDDLYNTSVDIRKCFLVGKCSIDNFVVAERNAFIDYSNSSFDYIIYDFIDFYRQNYDNENIILLYKQFKDSVNLTYSEERLLFVIITMIAPIDDNIFEISETIKYVNCTLKFLLEEDKEEEETNQDKLKE